MYISFKSERNGKKYFFPQKNKNKYILNLDATGISYQTRSILSGRSKGEGQRRLGTEKHSAG